MGALSGTASGLAGGLWGQYVSTDMITPSMVGSAVGGATSGGNVFEAATLGMIEGAYTAAGFDICGVHRTASVQYDESYSCHDFRDAYIKRYGTDKFVIWEREVAEVPADVILEGEVVARKGEKVSALTHSGIPLGRTQYGQTVVLSKLNVNLPVCVTTAEHFSGGYGYGSYRFVVPNDPSIPTTIIQPHY